MPKLVLKFNDQVLKEVPLGSAPVTIGRAPDNDLQIDNLAVSNHHARVYNEEGRMVLEDLDSLNGVFVKMTGEEELQSGQIIRIGQELLRSLIAILRLLLEHSVQDIQDLIGNLGIELKRIWNGILVVFEELFGDRPLLKGDSARKHVIERAAERVNVAACIGKSAVARLFRRHIVHGSDRGSVSSDFRFVAGIDPQGKAHVAQLHLTVLRDEKVRGLDVAMNDAFLEGVVERSSGLL